MKKSKRLLISVICIAETFIMAGSMSACAGRSDSVPPQQGSVPQSQLQQDVPQQGISGANETGQNTGQSGQSSNEQIAGEQISLDDAKNAALADAGVSAADVMYTKEKLDYEDGIAVYDIEFWADSVEYEYEINVATGEVYSKSMEVQQPQADHGNGNGENIGNSEAYIDADAAKAAALSHAGFTEEDISYSKCEFDFDDGQAVYEIEFYKDRREYEYTVSAVDGTVMEYDID